MRIDLKNGVYLTLNYDCNLDRIHCLSTIKDAIKSLKASKIPPNSVSLAYEHNFEGGNKYVFIYFEDGFINITNGLEGSMEINIHLDQKIYGGIILETLEKIRFDYKATI